MWVLELRVRHVTYAVLFRALKVVTGNQKSANKKNSER